MHTHVYKHRNVSKQTFHMFVYEHGSRIRTRFAYTKVAYTYTNIVHVYKQIACSYTNNVHVDKQALYVYTLYFTYTNNYHLHLCTIFTYTKIWKARIRTIFTSTNNVRVRIRTNFHVYKQCTCTCMDYFSRIQTMYVYIYGLFFTYTNKLSCAYTNYIPRIRMSYICIISSLDSHI